MTSNVTLTMPALRDVQTAIEDAIKRDEIRARVDPDVNRRIVHARKVERLRTANSVITHALSEPEGA